MGLTEQKKEEIQRANEVMSELLYSLIDSGDSSDLLSVVTNELATRDHLVEAAAVLSVRPYEHDRRDTIAQAIIDHPRTDDMIISLLCNNGYFKLWMMIAKTARAGERPLDKLIVKCAELTDRSQEKLAQAILDNANCTIDIVATMACYKKAPHAQKLAQARLSALSESLYESGEEEETEEKKSSKK